MALLPNFLKLKLNIQLETSREMSGKVKFLAFFTLTRRKYEIFTTKPMKMLILG